MWPNNMGPEINIDRQAQTNENVWDILDLKNGEDKKISEIYENYSIYSEDDVSDQEFLNYLNSLKGEEKTDFINLCSKITEEIFVQFIEDYWLPWTKDNLDEFRLLASFSIDDLLNSKLEETEEKEEEVEETKEEVEETREEVEETDESIKNDSELLTNFHNDFLITFDWIDLSQLWDENLISSIESLKNVSIAKLENLSDEDLILFYEDLKNKQESFINQLNNYDWLEGLLNQIAEQNPDNLVLFVKSLKKRDTNNILTSKIERYKQENPIPFWLKTFVIPSWDPIDPRDLPNMKVKWNVWRVDRWDGIEAITDFSKKPPERIITNWKYEFKSEPSLWPLLKPSIEYKKRLNELTLEKEEIIGDINRLKTEAKEIYENYQEQEKQSESLKDSWLDNSEEIAEIATKFKEVLDKVKQKENDLAEVDKQLVELEDDYIAEIKSKQSEYTEMMREKDEKKKDVLDFLWRSGFDKLPRALTNQLIIELKAWLIKIPGFDMDYWNINLEKWIFGQSPTEKDSTKWKENMVKFMNKAVYWELNPKESIFNSVNLYSKEIQWRVDPTSLSWTLRDKWIFDWMNYNKNKVIDNLKSSNEKTKEEQ